MIQYLTPSPVLALAAGAALTAMAWRRTGPSWLPRWRHGLALATGWAWLCCTPAVTNHFVAALEGPPPSASAPSPAASPDTTIIVLGSGQMWFPDGSPAPRLDENGWERLKGGVDLWRRTGGRLIFTGGPGSADQPTLAGVMRDVAVELGVPPEQTALAVSSRTTQQDIVSAKALLAGKPGPVWLVTSAIHMPRTLAVARHQGIPAQSFAVDYRQIRRVTWRAWIPDNASAERMNAALHEGIGRWYYRWKGWAD